MDWNDLADDDTLARYVARELRAGQRVRPLFTRIVDMGVSEPRAREAIERVRAAGPAAVLRAQRAARRPRWWGAVAMIALGLGLVVAGATRVSVDDVRWTTFVLTGAGLLLAAFGLTRITR